MSVGGSAPCTDCPDCLDLSRSRPPPLGVAGPRLPAVRKAMTMRTPLYDRHVAHGARMVDFAGWDMPVQYSTITEEHTTVRTAAGLFDISHMGRLSFGGPGSLDLIQHVWTN